MPCYYRISGIIKAFMPEFPGYKGINRAKSPVNKLLAGRK